MGIVNIKLGDIVTAQYKTGEYIGEIVDEPGMKKVAVSVKSIIKHPTQGDLHHPMDPSVSFFHQRRALAEHEIALMPLESVSLYSRDIPNYQSSLKNALLKEIANMESLHSNPSYEIWANKCLGELKQLMVEYQLT